MCVTGDLFNVFVFLEISSLSSYALISLGRTRRAPLAAFQYLILGTYRGDVHPDRYRAAVSDDRYAQHGRHRRSRSCTNRWRASERFWSRLRFMTDRTVCEDGGHSRCTQWLPNAYTYAPSVVTAVSSQRRLNQSFRLCVHPSTVRHLYASFCVRSVAA